MDALSRLEPVARPLLRQVDDALATLGAPPGHEIWSLLRRVGATPADAVAMFADLQPTGSRLGATGPTFTATGPTFTATDATFSATDARLDASGSRLGASGSMVGAAGSAVGGADWSGLRAAADTMRAQAEAYSRATVPANISWTGGAAEAYADRAASLASYQHGIAGTAESGTSGSGTDADSLAGRLRATASYVDEVVDWQGRSRDRIARALAAALSSAEAVTMRTQLTTQGPTPAVVLAAADIGSHVLAAASDALADGQDVHRAWADRLAELPYRGAPDAGPTRFDATLDVTH